MQNYVKFVSDRGDAEHLVNWLVRTSFLGIETRDSSFVYVEGDSEAKKKRKAADRLASRLDRPLRYRVHPAFRPYLDIPDDDLHLEDATTTMP
jgi:predicted nucleic acid-binding protein